jgi:hypothetical protein
MISRQNNWQTVYKNSDFGISNSKNRNFKPNQFNKNANQVTLIKIAVTPMEFTQLLEKISIN